MIFAVAMTFIDQTIVSIAAPTVQHDLGLSSSGMQWAINAYLLALAAFFAFGGRLGDTLGHTKMVVLGVIIFAVSSALCGLTPRGGAAEAWIVTFRAIQGLGGAIMFPAAIAIVVATFDFHSRGKALALFFGIAGGLTAIGPIAGGYLIQWTWRSIFWINVPVAIIALLLIARARPRTEHKRAPIDYRGLVLITGGVALSVFGFQQSQIWGWGNPAIGICIAAGVALLVVFWRVERRTPDPLINVGVFRSQAFTVQNVVLGISMMAFIPVFFFASEYGQISLALKATEASLLILYFFIGFVIAAQVGGRMLDSGGAKRPVVLGCVLAAVGFFIWGGKVTGLHQGSQVIWIIMAGAGMGLMLGQANTDAINRAGRLSYGEATGITQTVRNYGASLGFAILGTVLTSVFRSHVNDSLVAQGAPAAKAASDAACIAQLQGNCGGSGSGSVSSIPQFVRLDFASATQEVLYGMGVVMAVAAVVAFIGLRRGVQETVPEAAGAAEPADGAAVRDLAGTTDHDRRRSRSRPARDSRAGPGSGRPGRRPGRRQRGPGHRAVRRRGGDRPHAADPQHRGARAAGAARPGLHLPAGQRAGRHGRRLDQLPDLVLRHRAVLADPPAGLPRRPRSQRRAGRLELRLPVHHLGDAVRQQPDRQVPGQPAAGDDLLGQHDPGQRGHARGTDLRPRPRPAQRAGRGRAQGLPLARGPDRPVVLRARHPGGAGQPGPRQAVLARAGRGAAPGPAGHQGPRPPARGLSQFPAAAPGTAAA
jgi:EmrB/QacA subfamily drug resistance transporter